MINLKTLAAAIPMSLMLVAAGFVAPANAGGFWGNGKDSAKSSDVIVAEQLDKLVAESNRAVGLPSITNFFEKRMVRQLYEMRDNPEYRTYSYITTMQGRFVKICDSIGYGINASIQFSNPEKPVDLEDILGNREGSSQMLTAQAEPNGLFMPEGLAATYVMCLDPGSKVEGELKPVYIENEVIVSPFPLGG